ncbi:WYL domain-containing protein [Lachnospiraceae bacterium MD335]|nr:WYL domain-containing protein [Lachnospiraceae bacterium MD335]
MSEFKELIKSFSKSREYVRDFFVYGFKTRDEFGGWSGRTYDNERRRLESWLWGYVRQDYTANGKNIYLSIDSNLLDTNPLYRVWKAKSFTDNDIMLHFYILDYLQKYAEQTADAITDGILAEYDVMFEPQTVRRKCNQYARDGMLSKEKYGKEVLYRLNPPFRKTLSAHPGLANALAFYQLFSPLGIVGNTIMDNASLKNNTFRVKHSFFVHTLEDEILLDLLRAMHEEKSVLLNVKSTKSDVFQKTEGVPLKIFISTRTGRRFLCLYLPNAKRFTSVRLDAVKQVEIKELYPDYQTVKEHLEKNKASAWGVSFQNSNRRHLEHVKLTLHINEHFEAYMINRLEREGKGGIVRRIAPDTYCYETDVFDANEMLPWIRSFLGRIIAIETEFPKLNQLFQRDFAAMYRMYFGENAQTAAEDDMED